MATNSRNNNNEEVMVDETLSPEVKRMAEELGISDDGTSDQPTLSSSATEDVVVSTEQKRKPLKERIKENWEVFKAILKTTKGKFGMAIATLASIVIIAVTGTGIAAGVAAGDVNDAVDRANDVLDNGYVYVDEIDRGLSEIEPYADYLAPEEQIIVIKVGTEAKNWEENSEELSKIIANVQANKNVFSARDTANDELVPKTNELAGIDLSADSAYVSNLLTAVQARAGQATVSNQETIQSIINGEGSYYNMSEMQGFMNQINGYFADANGNGTADVEEIVNSIKDAQLKDLANIALVSMNGAKASADSTFATLQANWNKFTEYANSGYYATALSYYNTNIAPSASSLARNLSTVEAGNNNINNYVTQDQNKVVINNQFSNDERNQFSNSGEYQKTGLGEISSVNYTYNPATGDVTVVITGMERGSTANAFKVYSYKDKKGLTVYDAGAVINALNDKTHKINSQYYTEIGKAINANVSMTTNGQTTQVTGNYIKGYSYKRIEGTNTYIISAVLLGTDNSVVKLNVENLVLEKNEQLTQEKILNLIDKALSKSNIKVNYEIEPQITARIVVPGDIDCNIEL